VWLALTNLLFGNEKGELFFCKNQLTVYEVCNRLTGVRPVNRLIVAIRIIHVTYNVHV
jgi:hypothetical protein